MNAVLVLVDERLDWGQALPALRRWMDENGVGRVNLAYFGTAEPASYGIDYVALPGSNLPNVVSAAGVRSIARPERQPELPGWVAIGATHLQGTYLPPELREHYEFLRRRQPDAVLAGGAMYVYRVEQRGS